MIVEGLNDLKGGVQKKFAEDYTTAGLKLLIISWCVFVIVLTILINNKYMLAAILAYEVLP